MSKDQTDRISLLHFLAPKESIARLAKKFPSLKEAEGVSPFNSEQLMAWALESTPRPHARHAVQFILSLWDMHKRWVVGPFNVVEAFSSWDEEHKAVFLEWAQEPWFP